MEEKLKQEWTSTEINNVGSNNPDDIKNGRRRTALDNLAQRYRRFSNLGLMMLLWAPCMALGHIFPHNTFTFWLLVGFEAYFATVAVMDRWLYNGITRIDCSTMSVVEVARLATYYRKKHLTFVAILLPIAFLLIGGMAYIGSGETAFIYGLLFGAIFGAAIGAMQLMKFLNAYRDLRDIE